MRDTGAMDALDQAINHFSGVSALARALGVRQSVVSNWRMRGKVPAERCAAIEALTAGLVTCRDLRPDVFTSHH
jgi:DNA-binding transcriptional regulator YdaS (Cro superfamily)